MLHWVSRALVLLAALQALITRGFLISSKIRTPSHPTPLFFSGGDGTPKQPEKRRIIAPEELDSLFGVPMDAGARRGEGSVYDDTDDEDLSVVALNLDEGDDEQRGGEEGGQNVKGVQLTPSVGMSAAMAEVSSVAEAEYDAEEAETDASIGDNDEDESFYTDLSRVLDSKKLRRSVRDSISMRESTLGQALIDRKIGGDVRTTRYNPTEFSRGDPMKYGAYRRWQPSAADEESKGGKSSASSSSSVRTGGKGGGVRGGRVAPGKGASKDKGKTTKTDGKDSFLNTLKNLGSAPTSGPTGTGVADPPPNKRNVQPKKAPPRKTTRRKLITPNDIDSLFAQPADGRGRQGSASGSGKVGGDVDDDDDDDEDEDEEDEEEGEGEGEEERSEMEGSRVNSLQVGIAGESAMTSEQQIEGYSRGVFGKPDDGTVPDWLQAAEKERKEAKQAAKRAKKSKKLTNDWRFWAAIVVTAGFASALWSVYQQTGGFAAGGMGGGGGPELII